MFVKIVVIVVVPVKVKDLPDGIAGESARGEEAAWPVGGRSRSRSSAIASVHGSGWFGLWENHEIFDLINAWAFGWNGGSSVEGKRDESHERNSGDGKARDVDVRLCCRDVSNSNNRRRGEDPDNDRVCCDLEREFHGEGRLVAYFYAI